MFCASLCATKTTQCTYEPSHQLCELDSYDHFRWIYQLCVVHFQRNLHKLQNSVSQGVYNAMLSIACSKPHPDFKNTLRIIQSGGKKAKGMSCPLDIDSKHLVQLEYSMDQRED